MRPIIRKGLVAGAIVALVVSFFHSQMFRSDVFGWSGLIVWYLVSLLLGCGSGFLAGLLISLIPARLNSSLSYLGGALFGVVGYLIQVYLFLLYVFRYTLWGQEF
jgi:hypothetical protein